MLIDSNAYVGHWPFRKFKYDTLDTLLGRMKEFGTDISVISNLNGVFYKNTQDANEELVRWINKKKEYKNRFIPFAVINPVYGGWRDDFKFCSTKMGMKGVRLYPKYHRYEIIHPSCIELVKICRDNDMPVVFSSRMVDSRPSSWMDLKSNTWSLKEMMPIIKAVPDAKYLLVNLAGGVSLDEEDLLLFKKSKILMDTSGRSMREWPSLLSAYGPDKFCFGTQSPILDYFTGLLRIISLKESEANQKVKEMIKSENLSKVLSI